MAERGQPGARPERAEHETGAAVVGEFGDRLARQFGGAPVQLERAVGNAELAESDRRAAEAVGLQHVATRFEITPVDLADQVGTAVAQNLGAVLEPEKVALDVEIARLNLCPHRAVAQHDPIGQVIEEMGHQPLSAALRGRGKGPPRRGGRVRWPSGGAGAAAPAPLTLPSPPASGWRGKILRFNPNITPPRRRAWGRARRAGGRS